MRQLKISKPTFKHVVPSTALRSSATNLQVIPKGKQPLCHIFRLMDSIRRTHRFAYVEFAEPEFIDPALALDNSLFHGRLIKVCFDSCVMTTPPEIVSFCKVLAKRTNVPGFNRGRGRGRGGGGGGGGYRGGYRGGFRGGGGGYSPYRGYRGRYVLARGDTCIS